MPLEINEGLLLGGRCGGNLGALDEISPEIADIVANCRSMSRAMMVIAQGAKARQQ